MTNAAACMPANIEDARALLAYLADLIEIEERNIDTAKWGNIGSIKGANRYMAYAIGSFLGGEAEEIITDALAKGDRVEDAIGDIEADRDAALA